MKRIAYFAHAADISGPNSALRGLLSALDRREFEPVVYFPADGPFAAELQAAGERCRIVHTSRLRRSVTRYPLFALELFTASRRLVDCLKQDRIALAHVNTCVTPQPAMAATFAKIPVIHHVRESLRRNRLNNLYFALVLRLAQGVIAVSRSVRDDILSRTSVRCEQIEVVYDGLDLRTFDEQCRLADGEAVAPKCEVGVTTIALPAFFVPHKGHEVLLAAIARLVHDYHLDVVAWLIGHEAPEDGDHFTRHLKTCCDVYNIVDRVRFLGFRRNVPAIVSAADIICMPSTYPDPFPNAVLEGMAASKPVVGSATGGIPELLNDGRAGILVPPGDADALASALARVVRDRGLRERLGRAARGRVKEHFTTGRHAEHVQQLYRSTIGTSHGSSTC